MGGCLFRYVAWIFEAISFYSYTHISRWYTQFNILLNTVNLTIKVHKPKIKFKGSWLLKTHSVLFYKRNSVSLTISHLCEEEKFKSTVWLLLHTVPKEEIPHFFHLPTKAANLLGFVDCTSFNPSTYHSIFSAFYIYIYCYHFRMLKTNVLFLTPIPVNPSPFPKTPTTTKKDKNPTIYNQS